MTPDGAGGIFMKYSIPGITRISLISNSIQLHEVGTSSGVKVILSRIGPLMPFSRISIVRLNSAMPNFLRYIYTLVMFSAVGIKFCAAPQSPSAACRIGNPRSCVVCSISICSI